MLRKRSSGQLKHSTQRWRYLIAPARLFEQRKIFIPLCIIFLAGTALRILYAHITPYFDRAHDIYAHIDYINYVASYWWIPPASEGWEFHQAPLYYFLSAIWMRVEGIFEVPKDVILSHLHWGSVLISITTLAVGIWVGKMFFPAKKEQTNVLLFAGIIATFPSLIYLSSRITNNGLYHLFAFLIIALLLRWWLSEKIFDWYVLWITIAVGLLTRTSTLIFIPVVLVSLFLRRKVTNQKKLEQGLGAVLIVFLIAGWLPFVRLALEEDRTNSLTFGKQQLDPVVIVPNTFKNFATFNPIKILQVPYNDPYRDEARRQYYWEYFFRAAFFGQWSFPQSLHGISVLILFFALCTLPFIAMGLWKQSTLQLYETIPILLLLLVLLASNVWYRLYVLCTCAQDFRYSIAAILPLSYYLLSGIQQTPPPFQYLGKFIVIGLCASCAIFIIALSAV